MGVSYRECLKNHAATVGGHAVDGCGEFMLLITATSTNPTSLKCAACGCHRNFHRREPDDQRPYRLHPSRSFGSYRQYHTNVEVMKECVVLTPSPSSSPSSPIPLPISHIPPPSPFQFSAPHMLLALSSASGYSGAPPDFSQENKKETKRKRTKFSRDQKEKMYLFSEKIGWKIRRNDEKLVEEFCNEIGIGKRVLKVWMHNNRRDSQKCNNGEK